jgi:hypothetical protein
LNYKVSDLVKYYNFHINYVFIGQAVTLSVSVLAKNQQ